MGEYFFGLGPGHLRVICRQELTSWGMAEMLRLAEEEARLVDVERDRLLKLGATVVLEVLYGHLYARTRSTWEPR